MASHANMQSSLPSVLDSSSDSPGIETRTPGIETYSDNADLTAEPDDLDDTSSGLFDNFAAKGIILATLWADNDAATTNLDLIRRVSNPESYKYAYLVKTSDKIGYKIVIGPASVRNWWTIGAGAKNADVDQDGRSSRVDFLLSLPDNEHTAQPARMSVAKYHARLELHLESGMLVLRSISRRPSIYHGGQRDASGIVLRELDNPLIKTSAHVLSQPRNYMRFGSFAFCLEYNNHDAATMAELRLYRDQLLGFVGGSPSRLLDMSPCPNHKLILPKVYVHRTLDISADCTMHAGVITNTGRPVLVSVFHINAHNYLRVRKAFDLASNFNPDVTAECVAGLDGHWCEHGHSPPCSFNRTTPVADDPDFEEAVCFTQWLYQTLLSDRQGCKDVMSSPLDIRLQYFYDTLRGLVAIHDRNMLHGRITPSCLALVDAISNETDPSRDWDLGMKSRAAFYRFDGMRQGPHRFDKPYINLIWTAPEVWRSSPDAPYDAKADVFSLGMVWLDVLMPDTIDPGFRMDAERHATLRQQMDEQLRSQVSAEFFDLVTSMTTLDPGGRPAVRAAMFHPAWRPMLELDDDANQDSSRATKRLRSAAPSPESSHVDQLPVAAAAASSPDSSASDALGSPAPPSPSPSSPEPSAMDAPLPSIERPPSPSDPSLVSDDSSSSSSGSSTPSRPSVGEDERVLVAAELEEVETSHDDPRDIQR